jgi:hypothetical protein
VITAVMLVRMLKRAGWIMSANVVILNAREIVGDLWGVTRLETETFRLELELGQWIAHLDELGSEKKPVAHTKLRPPLRFCSGHERTQTFSLP